ncbi:MAG TPA: YbfB/YjiJ family MFS transporter [Alphaproteobacteria bacterium]|nr:YbfB/YjiJ family MFS transporter [Alphaproteobacteria bacterium]
MMTGGARQEQQYGRVLLGGLCTMVIAMGIGRFAYTPILPAMQAAAGLGPERAGLLASANYLGYLIGALAGGYLFTGHRRRHAFRATLLVGLAVIGLMALTDSFAAWSALRLISGLSSGALFVWSADIVIRALAQAGRGRLSGVHFAGVGFGIALTGIAVPLLDGLGGWRVGWAGLALLALPIAVPAWLWVAGRPPAPAVAAPVGERATNEAPTRPVACFPLPLLALAYFLEGFGCIVSGTFLVAMLAAGPGGGGLLGPLAWTVVGLAGAPSCLLWSLAASRWGYPGTLVAAHLLQAAGIALSAGFTATAPVLVAAMLFGGTFMGITTLVVAFGREIAGAAPARAIGLLTASFGLGQIIGPSVAGWLAARSGGSFVLALEVAAAAVLAGAILLLIGQARARRRAEAVAA